MLKNQVIFNFFSSLRSPARGARVAEVEVVASAVLVEAERVFFPLFPNANRRLRKYNLARAVLTQARLLRIRLEMITAITAFHTEASWLLGDGEDG